MTDATSPCRGFRRADGVQRGLVGEIIKRFEAKVSGAEGRGLPRRWADLWRRAQHARASLAARAAGDCMGVTVHFQRT